jgi:hypothetical protein
MKKFTKLSVTTTVVTTTPCPPDGTIIIQNEKKYIFIDCKKFLWEGNSYCKYIIEQISKYNQDMSAKIEEIKKIRQRYDKEKDFYDIIPKTAPYAQVVYDKLIDLQTDITVAWNQYEYLKEKRDKYYSDAWLFCQGSVGASSEDSNANSNIPNDLVKSNHVVFSSIFGNFEFLGVAPTK